MPFSITITTLPHKCKNHFTVQHAHRNIRRHSRHALDDSADCTAAFKKIPLWRFERWEVFADVAPLNCFRVSAPPPLTARRWALTRPGPT